MLLQYKFYIAPNQKKKKREKHNAISNISVPRTSIFKSIYTKNKTISVETLLDEPSCKTIFNF